MFPLVSGEKFAGFEPINPLRDLSPGKESWNLLREGLGKGRYVMSRREDDLTVVPYSAAGWSVVLSVL